MASKKVKIVLVVISTTLAMIACELVLRWTIPLYTLYAGIETIPEMAEKHFRYRFAIYYGRRLEWLKKFEDGEARKVFDRHLGWEVPGPTRVRGRVYPLVRQPSRSRVLFIGDSYTHGDDVEADDTFAFLVGEMTGSEAINMGVSGYGIDQAVLKYLSHGSEYTPDLVVLGIYQHDYHRVRLKFHTLRKPVVEVDGGTISVIDSHIELPTVYAKALIREVDRQSFLLALIESSLGRFNHLVPAQRNAYFRTTDTIVEALLRRLMEDLAHSGSSLLIVHIPRGDGFSSPRNVRKMFEYPASQHLLGIYEKLGIPYIDLRKEFLARAPRAEVFKTYYVHHLDGKAIRSRKIGHLSPHGHLKVARMIAERICAMKLMEADCDRPPYGLGTDSSGQLVARWEFDQSGPNVIDRGPHLLHGTPNDAVAFHRSCGQNRCAEFDGNSSEVTVRRRVEWGLESDFRIEVQLMPMGKEYPHSQCLVGRKGAFTLALRNGKPAFYGHGLVPEKWHTGPLQLELGAWHTVTVVCKDGELRILHNGQVIYGRSVTGSIRDGQMGAVLGYGAGHYRGLLGSVSVWRQLACANALEP